MAVSNCAAKPTRRSTWTDWKTNDCKHESKQAAQQRPYSKRGILCSPQDLKRTSFTMPAYFVCILTPPTFNPATWFCIVLLCCKLTACWATAARFLRNSCVRSGKVYRDWSSSCSIIFVNNPSSTVSKQSKNSQPVAVDLGRLACTCPLALSSARPAWNDARDDCWWSSAFCILVRCVFCLPRTGYFYKANK